MAEIGRDLEKAASLLRRGEVIGIPTETVYGLAGNALLDESILKIFEVKQRPQFNPLILHTWSVEQIQAFVSILPKQVHDLAQQHWPGPLTILLPKSSIVPDLLTAGNERVAIRIPNHPLTLSLLKKLDFPLAAPSANPFGYISPTTADHVADQLGPIIPYILDGGSTTVGIESTIIGWEAEGGFKLYRHGGLEPKEIERITGPLSRIPSSAKPQSSGMLKSHYAPTAALFVGEIEELWSTYASPRTAVLSFQKSYSFVSDKQQFILSEKGDIREAARNLFAYLRRLDNGDFDTIIADYVPDEGIGQAINDRLERAQHEHKPDHS
ncbi:MAG: L-threonylcarbamoyladenylate synthase [Bacteroidota bacterium]